MRNILFIILLLSFIGYGQKPNIQGKWYHATTGHYYRSVDRKDIARSYEFKQGKKVEFSSCTDMCGCMRMTMAGTFKWENDSTILVTYTKRRRDRSTTFLPMKEKRVERLVIKKVNKGLHIYTLR